jgi:hypothetical protein
VSSSNGKPETAAELLGLQPIDLFFPCAACDHQQADHGPECGVKEAILAWQKDGAPMLGPCPCKAFEGTLEDGLPKAIRMRMLSNMEWSTLQLGASMPAQVDPDAAPEVLNQDARRVRQEWARLVVARAVTHVRRIIDGESQWQPCKVVLTDDEVDGPWVLTIEQLDRGGTGLVGALAMALVTDFNDGGPFGGVVRSFRAG